MQIGLECCLWAQYAVAKRKNLQSVKKNFKIFGQMEILNFRYHGERSGFPYPLQAGHYLT